MELAISSLCDARDVQATANPTELNSPVSRPASAAAVPIPSAYNTNRKSPASRPGSAAARPNPFAERLASLGAVCQAQLQARASCVSLICLSSVPVQRAIHETSYIEVFRVNVPNSHICHSQPCSCQEAKLYTNSTDCMHIYTYSTKHRDRSKRNHPGWSASSDLSLTSNTLHAL